ncbi:uncharacterized protein PgNI_11995 [Pyricularia grisea]|uniref:Uncharacterized protein n=1 Tax=Pyricularia grisea TaxID=148305 RepID=A0A6P8AQE3_PYRGI|nr:uncharacterized protein PgNI_11995 [Pyricularia grisea]TLD04272.1 hypothetical protein PgNI_11995 [Pyricularia grisea]
MEHPHSNAEGKVERPAVKIESCAPWSLTPAQDTETPAPNSVLPTPRRSSAASRAGTVALSIASFETGLHQPVPPGLERPPDGRKADSIHSPAYNNPQQAQHQPRRNPDPPKRHAYYPKRHHGTSVPQAQSPLSSNTWGADMFPKYPYANLNPSAHPQTTSTAFNINRLACWQRRNLTSAGLLQGDFPKTSNRPDLQVQDHTWLSTPHFTPAASHPILGHVALSDVLPIMLDKISGSLSNPRQEDVNIGNIFIQM